MNPVSQVAAILIAAVLMVALRRSNLPRPAKGAGFVVLMVFACAHDPRTQFVTVSAYALGTLFGLAGRGDGGGGGGLRQLRDRLVARARTILRPASSTA